MTPNETPGEGQITSEASRPGPEPADHILQALSKCLEYHGFPPATVRLSHEKTYSWFPGGGWENDQIIVHHNLTGTEAKFNSPAVWDNPEITAVEFRRMVEIVEQQAEEKEKLLHTAPLAPASPGIRNPKFPAPALDPIPAPEPSINDPRYGDQAPITYDPQRERLSAIAHAIADFLADSSATIIPSVDFGGRKCLSSARTGKRDLIALQTREFSDALGDWPSMLIVFSGSTKGRSDLMEFLANKTTKAQQAALGLENEKDDTPTPAQDTQKSHYRFVCTKCFHDRDDHNAEDGCTICGQLCSTTNSDWVMSGQQHHPPPTPGSTTPAPGVQTPNTGDGGRDKLEHYAAASGMDENHNLYIKCACGWVSRNAAWTVSVGEYVGHLERIKKGKLHP